MIMAPTQYQQCLDRLHLGHRDIAVLLRCAVQLSKMWSRGERSVPPAVAEWLLRCIDVRDEHPYPDPPKQWRRPGRSGAEEITP